MQYYATALIMGGRYVDFQWVLAPDRESAKNAARAHIRPEFRRSIATAILGTCSEDGIWTQPSYMGLTALYETGAFTRIGDATAGAEIHDYVVKHFCK